MTFGQWLDIFCVATLLAIFLQEFLHRHYQDRPQGLARHLDESSAPGATRSWRHVTKQLRIVRIVQLFLTMSVFAVAANITGHRVLIDRLGQVCALIMLIQLVRMLGRRVIDRWIVLTILGAEQAVLLLVVIFLEPVTPERTELAGLEWLGGAAAILATAALSISFAFALSFLIKLKIPERSGLFYELPPLVVAEHWVSRLSMASTWLFVVSFGAFLATVLMEGMAMWPFIWVGCITALLLGSRLAARRPAAYHPGLAVMLVLANLGALALIVSGGLSPGA
ncbi:MAG: hypothetical protein R6U36_08765 [Candidatus Fermentibacteraceae bacterium]